MPEGAFITAIGGLQPRQFAENRLPTLAELDAAAPRHPVYIHVAFNGPAATNSLGRTFFESKGVPVSEAGAIAVNGPTWDALDALRANWTLADTKRTMQQVFGYFNSVGLTTVHSVLGSQERGPAQYFGTPDHRPMLELKKEGDADAAAAPLLQHRPARRSASRATRSCATSSTASWSISATISSRPPASASTSSTGRSRARCRSARSTTSPRG